MKDVQCYELFGGIALKNHAFSFFIIRQNINELSNKFILGEIKICFMLTTRTTFYARFPMISNSTNIYTLVLFLNFSRMFCVELLINTQFSCVLIFHLADVSHDILCSFILYKNTWLMLLLSKDFKRK